MDAPLPILRLVIWALLLAGCGPRVTTGELRGSGNTVASRCFPGHYVRAADTCVRLEGSTWVMRYMLPGNDRWSIYRLHFEGEGQLVTENPRDTTPHNDTWTQEGEDVHIYFNDRFVDYAGALVSSKWMRGVAVNVNGTQWEFEAWLDDEELPVDVRRVLENTAQELQ